MARTRVGEPSALVGGTTAVSGEVRRWEWRGSIATDLDPGAPPPWPAVEPAARRRERMPQGVLLVASKTLPVRLCVRVCVCSARTTTPTGEPLTQRSHGRPREPTYRAGRRRLPPPPSTVDTTASSSVGGDTLPAPAPAPTSELSRPPVPARTAEGPVGPRVGRGRAADAAMRRRPRVLRGSGAGARLSGWIFGVGWGATSGDVCTGGGVKAPHTQRCAFRVWVLAACSCIRQPATPIHGPVSAGYAQMRGNSPAQRDARVFSSRGGLESVSR